MPIFKVKCFQRAIWDGNEDREVEAENEQRAAEAICGEALMDSGKPGQLRAQVWATATPGAKKLFYIRG